VPATPRRHFNAGHQTLRQAPAAGVDTAKGIQNREQVEEVRRRVAATGFNIEPIKRTITAEDTAETVEHTEQVEKVNSVVEIHVTVSVGQVETPADSTAVKSAHVAVVTVDEPDLVLVRAEVYERSDETRIAVQISGGKAARRGVVTGVDRRGTHTNVEVVIDRAGYVVQSVSVDESRVGIGGMSNASSSG